MEASEFFHVPEITYGYYRAAWLSDYWSLLVQTMMMMMTLKTMMMMIIMMSMSTNFVVELYPIFSLVRPVDVVVAGLMLLRHTLQQVV